MTREEFIAQLLTTPQGRSALAQSMFAPAQNVLDGWHKWKKSTLRDELTEVMDKLVNALDGSEPPFDKTRLLSLRSDLKSLTSRLYR